MSVPTWKDKVSILLTEQSGETLMSFDQGIANSAFGGFSLFFAVCAINCVASITSNSAVIHIREDFMARGIVEP